MLVFTNTKYDSIVGVKARCWSDPFLSSIRWRVRRLPATLSGLTSLRKGWFSVPKMFNARKEIWNQVIFGCSRDDLSAVLDSQTRFLCRYCPLKLIQWTKVEDSLYCRGRWRQLLLGKQKMCKSRHKLVKQSPLFKLHGKY